MGYRSFLLILFCSLAFSACEDDDSSNTSATDNEINEWIEETMREHYLWYVDMPDKSSLDFSANPETFFSTLLSDSDGKTSSSGHQYYSTLKRYSSTKSISDADDSYGLDFATYHMQSGNDTYNIALVVYVLKDSPAEEAGLKRGDWIIGVDDALGIEDYDLIRSGSGVTLQLAKRKEGSNEIVYTNDITLGASREVANTPFLKDSIYVYGDKRIGYLMYNRFYAGTDDYDLDDTSYNDYLQELFENFKSQGVNEFVLDLRYNGGGLVTCAQLLASLLVRKEALGDTFCTLEYNDKNTDSNETLTFLNTTDVLAGNLDLDRVFFLTGSTTASASELVINSLRPYLGADNVYLIGKRTYGKVVGMTIYNKSTTYGWVLYPVTFRSYNKDHEADYAEGFVPNREINEYEYDLVEFGDLSDPLLGQAYYEITGQSTSIESASLQNVQAIRQVPSLFYKNVLIHK